MARTLNPFKRLALLALLCCSGCASQHASHPADSYSPTINLDNNGGFAKGLLQDASAASMNNWNFRTLGR